MIRVNLLNTQTSTGVPVKRAALLPKEQRSALVGLAILLTTAAGVGAFWWHLSRERSGVEQAIVDAEAELVNLKNASALVERANARKTELTERLSLIERLREAKRAPVTLLTTLSQSVVEGMWLTEMKQSGHTVQIDGRALSVSSVTDFAQQLQDSGHFQKPVEIVATSTEVLEETQVIKFTLKAEAIAPVNPAQAKPSAPPSTPPAPPTKPGA
jgi:type IV pilus assembly protein PilN